MNFNTRILGRRGVMRVTVAPVGSLDQALPVFGESMAGFDFKDGHAQYVDGLLLAEFALFVFLWRLEPQLYRAEALLVLMAAALLTHLGLVWALARSWWVLGLPAEGRIPALLICALSPWALARSGDLLGRRLLAGADLFAAAQACLPEPQRRALAAACLRRADHPRARAGETAWDVGAWEAWCREQGWDPAGLRARPRPDSGSVAWCPRCLQQYRRGGACSDCGLSLREF